MLYKVIKPMIKLLIFIFYVYKARSLLEIPIWIADRN